MAAAEEATGGPAMPDGGGAEEPAPRDQAEAGAPLDPGRSRRRRLIGGAVVVALLLVALRAAGIGQGDGANGESGERARSTSTTAASGEETSTSGAVTSAPAGSTTTVAPPDVARPRPPLDVAVAPPGGDVVEVARWWAAVFVAYEGAEPAQELVARLAAFTTPAWQAELMGVPPAASYDAPVEIAGVSAQLVEPAAGGAGGAGGGGATAGQTAQVTVETPGALVVYELVLVQDAAGTWQVDRATRRV